MCWGCRSLKERTAPTHTRMTGSATCFTSCLAPCALRLHEFALLGSSGGQNIHIFTDRTVFGNGSIMMLWRFRLLHSRHGSVHLRNKRGCLRVLPIQWGEIAPWILPRLVETSIMHDLWCLTRFHVCLVHVCRCEIEHSLHTSSTVMHHVPRIVEVSNKSLALSVENVLIVVDVSRLRAICSHS